MAAETKYMRVQFARRIDNSFPDEEGGGDDGNASDTSSTDATTCRYQPPKLRHREVASSAPPPRLRSSPAYKSLESQSSVNLHCTLYQAARDGDVDQIKSYLDTLNPEYVYVKVNELDENKLTPLHYAARYNHVNAVQLLIERGADVGIKGEDSLTPLHFAARYGYNRQNKQPKNEINCPKDGCKSVISVLVDKGAPLNWKDTYGMTPLHYAAMRGNEVATELLLKYDQINTEVYDKQEMTPLHCAALYNHPEIVKTLLAAEAGPTAADENESTPLHLAAAAGNYEIVQIMLDDVEKRYDTSRMLCYIEDKNKSEFSALHLAINKGSYEIVDLLLSKGADSKNPSINECHPMHLAAVSGNVDIMKSLIYYGAEINCSNIYRETPLHKAAAYNNVEVIDFLLKNHAFIEYRDNSHFTPLLIAAAEGHEKAIEKLLEADASIDVIDKTDKSVVFWACQENHPKALQALLKDEDGVALVNRCDRYDNSPLHIASLRGYVEIVEILLAHFADTERRNENERTPLHMAANNGHAMVSEMLLKREKSLINCEDENSNTALHLAALHGHYQTVTLLLNAGANINARNCHLWTALDCAASRGWKRTCEILLTAGCPVDIVDKANTTPLHLASREGHKDVVKLLLKWSTNIGRIDKENKNCLDMAIDRGHDGVAFEILSSKGWKDVLRNKYNKTKYGLHQTPLRRLIRKMPEVAEFVFDKCITQNGYAVDHRKFKVTYNYEFLDDIFTPYGSETNDIKEDPGMVDTMVLLNDDIEKDKREPYTTSREILKDNHPLMLMIRFNRQNLLNHRLCVRLLQHKWESYARYVYYFNLLTFIFFLTFLTAYILTGLPPCPTEEFGDPKCCWFLNSTCQPYIGKCKHVEDEQLFPEICRNLIYVFAVVHLLKEIYQVYQNGNRYFNLENTMEWACYISALLFVADFSECSEVTGIREVWQWELGAISIFLAWMVFVMFISKFPFLGIYVVMFVQILSTFANFSFVFFLFVVAFGLAFYTLLQNQDPFETPGESILKTSVMMIGEFEYDAIFNDPESSVYFKGPTYLLFVLFLLLMSIIIMNLLVGLAVDDIKGVQEQAQLKRLSMKVELVLTVERILPLIALRRCVIKEKTISPNDVKQPMLLRMLRLQKPRNNVASSFKSSLEGLEDKQSEFSRQLRVISDSIQLLSKDINHLKEIIEKNNRDSA